MRRRQRLNRASIALICLMLAASACSSDGAADSPASTDATGTDATTATTAGTTTTVTTIPVVVGTTLPSVPLAHQVRSAGLGDCDWPEVYPSDADAIVVTINDVDSRSDLVTFSEGLAEWEILTTSDEMLAAGMQSYAHRTVRLYGTTLIGGAYLFDDTASAAAYLDEIGTTFTDPTVIGPITEAGTALTEIESPSPGAFSLTDGIPPEQEYDGFVSARITDPDTGGVTYAIDAYAWQTGDQVGFLRVAYPSTDTSRQWAAGVAASEMIARSGGPAFAFFKQPLTNVPDLGLLLDAVLATDDTFNGDAYELIGDGFFYDVGTADLRIPFDLQPEFDTSEWPITPAQMEAAGIVNTAVTPRTQWGASGPVMSVVAHRYANEGAAIAAYDAIAARTVTLDGLYEFGLLRDNELEAVGEDLDSFGDRTDPDSGFGAAYWQAVLRHPELITIVPLEESEFGDQSVGVLFSGPDPDGPAREKVHLAWRTGSHLQILKVSAEFGSDPDALLEELYRLAGELQARASELDGIPAPAEITGLENYTGYDAQVYPKCQPEEATLDSDPWLTASAVVVNGDPWVLPITADGGEAIVLSRSQLEALTADEIGAVETQRQSLGLIEAEVPTDLNIWDETGLRAFAHRTHISDGNANATLVSGAYRYEDAASAEASFSNTDGSEEFWRGWFTTSRDRGLRSAANLLSGTRGDPSDEWEGADGANMPNIVLNGSNQSTGTLTVTGDDGYQIIIAQWIEGDLLQFLRARMPLDDSVTMDAFWDVYAAIGQRVPCSPPRTVQDGDGGLSDSLTGEACSS